MEAWSWACEDELEALGMTFVLERAGVEVRVERAANDPSRVQLHVPSGVSRERVESLTSAMLAHHARKDAQANVARYERREKLGRRVLLGFAAIGCLLCLVGLLSSF